jgi:glycosyltransferase involved in cell wall biosynthesis
MKLSIALCTFNGERYLVDQLESISRQTRLPDELVVCDDGSNDQTAALLACFAERVPFKVSFCVNAERLGPTQNFARAFSLCSGDVILPCDQDDVWEPEKLDQLEQAFEGDPDLLLAFHDLAVVTPDGHMTGQTQWERLGFRRRGQADLNQDRAFDLLLRFNVVTGAALAFRSSLRKTALPIPHGFIHDEWLALVAAALGKVICINRQLVRYRQHPGQAIGPATGRLFAQFRYARDQMGRDYFLRMAERTSRLHERLSLHADLLRHSACLPMVAEKFVHAQARVKMRDQTLIRWPLAIGEAVRGRYQRFGYGFKSFLQDLVL